MRFSSETSSDDVCEQLFTLGEIPGVLWTPEGAAGTRPLILLGHGGGLHKKAPGIVARARRFAAECDFAVAAVDVPGHGDRPKDEELDRLATENQARVEAGEELAPLIAGFQALVARRTVPEWRAVLDAVQSREARGDAVVRTGQHAPLLRPAPGLTPSLQSTTCRPLHASTQPLGATTTAEGRSRRCRRAPPPRGW